MIPQSVWEVSEVEEKAKVRGMKVAAAAHNRDLALAREIAVEIGQRGVFVTADDVRHVLAERFPDIEPGNWLGSVWERKTWQAVGYTHSVTKGSHGNTIRLWQLRSVRHATEGESC